MISAVFLCETFRSHELLPGIKPVMSYVSYNGAGIVRGPHEITEIYLRS